MSTVDLASVFDGTLGLPCYLVHQGYGSILTFEFGEPELIVRERTSRNGERRRFAHVRGAKHLCIFCCHWQAFQNDVELAWSEDTRDQIDRAAVTLNGQKLTGVIAEPGVGRSTFLFDLGGRLETWPYGDEETDEQWMLMEKETTFAYRADGKYGIHDNKAEPDSHVWQDFAPAQGSQ